MPSAKPKTEQIKQVRKSRDLYDKPRNSTSEVRGQILALLDGGYLDAVRLAAVADAIEKNEVSARTFPGNAIIYAARRVGAGEIAFDDNVEADLLHAITASFLTDQYEAFQDEAPTDSEVLREIVGRESWYGRDPLSFLFDSAIPDVAQPLVGFTGPTTTSRRVWFELLNDIGGAGCVPDWYCDALVVADAAVADKSFTSTIYAAMRSRAAYGRPLVVIETTFLDWANKRLVDR